MALPLLRFCGRNRPVSILLRCFTSKPLLVNQSRLRLAPAAYGVGETRQYSSEPGRQKQKQMVVVLGIPNPVLWFRTRMHFFLIRMFIDEEFRFSEFAEGAIQAFSHVSRLLSQCQFEALEGLVAEDLKGKLEEKCANLPVSHQRALFAEPDEIMYTTAADVAIHYESERKFVSILMRYWYLTSAGGPGVNIKGAKIVKIGEERENQETKTLLTADYEFQREFTKGVTPNWIITRIAHSKLID